jgi:hypothetical protein
MFLACWVMLQPLLASPALRPIGLVMAAWMALQLLGSGFALLIDFVTRAVLTPTHLRVHRGLWTDDVPLSAITEAAVVDVSRWVPAVSIAGALLRRERDYLDWGDGGALRVSWRDEKGRARRIWVRLDEAELFLSRIESLREGDVTGVRAAADEALVDARDADVATNATTRDVRRR